MGGFGSGNRRDDNGLPACEDCLPLDIRDLARKGGLVPGRSGSASIRIGKQSLHVNFEAFPHLLRLKYLRPDVGMKLEHALVVVELDRTQQRLGGKRSWFLCPNPVCGRRCGILYFKGQFACRVCHGLAYASQRQSPEQRAFSQARKIRRALGGSGSLEEPFPDRPTGMQKRTYERLIEKYDEYIERGQNTPFDRMMAPLYKAMEDAGR